ncbi:MAG TPA: ATP-binding protein [Bacillota bacterium]|nr:ATP-binding protein [Bacillota bacterium]
MKELSLHILDIVQNSIRAEADRITIEVDERTVEDRLTITIRDNGKGMSPEQVNNASDPFYTSRTTRRVGLGLSLLKAAAERCNGHMRINSALGHGTEVITEFQRSHWDRAPVGDMTGTMITLIASNPEIDFVYRHRLDNREYILDTAEIRLVLEGLPLSNPSVLSVIRKDMEEGLRELQIAT